MATETVSATGVATIEKALVILEEIATLANTLDTEFYYSCASGSDRDWNEVDNQLDRLRKAICHIGLLADFGAGCGIRGGVAEWLLSPSFTWCERGEQEAAA